MIVDWHSRTVDAEESGVLVHDPGRAHGRGASTDLYPTDPWHRVSLVNRRSTPPDPRRDILRFKFGAALIDGLRDFLGLSPTNLDGRVRELSDALCWSIETEVAALFPTTSWQLSRIVKPMASLPAVGVVSGQTTNGLHFDAVTPSKPVRIGINLGLAPRHVIFVPKTKPEIHEELGIAYTEPTPYTQIPALNLKALRFIVSPGDGWSMPTEDLLPDGFSSFVLAEATIS
jgi:hypothetical protein